MMKIFWKALKKLEVAGNEENFCFHFYENDLKP